MELFGVTGADAPQTFSMFFFFAKRVKVRFVTPKSIS